MVIPAYATALRVASRIRFGPQRVVASLQGREGAARRWSEWANQHRTNTPLVWIHGASVGELASIDPVVLRLRQLKPECQIILTHTSSSVESWTPRWNAERVDYMPMDDERSTETTFAALRPSLLVFSRGDVWPTHVDVATNSHVPTVIIGGQVSPGSNRLAWPVRNLFEHIYQKLTFVAATDGENAERYRRLGVDPSAIDVIGDPRHDHVLERITQLRDLPTGVFPAPTRHTLIGGSTDAFDADLLLKAASGMRDSAPMLLVIAPHDPNPRTVKQLAHKAERLGFRSAVFSELGDATDEVACVIVDRMGLLFDLYAFADSAYIGGGFRKRRLHSVIEPAAYGVPVIVGPHWKRFADAQSMVENGGVVALGTGDPIESLKRELVRLIEDPGYRWHRGLSARRTLLRGAADRAAAIVLRYLAT